MLMKHCAGHRLPVEPYPGGAHSITALRGWKPSEAALIDFGLVICSSCPPSALPSPVLLICRTKSWLPPALLRRCSIQSGVAGWAACVPRGTARKRQPLLVRGSARQEQSRFYWCSKWQFSQCYTMTTGRSRFQGVETWTIWKAFIKKKTMHTRLGTGPWKRPWGLSFLSFPVNPLLVVTDDRCLSGGTHPGKSAHVRQMGTASGLPLG